MSEHVSPSKPSTSFVVRLTQIFAVMLLVIAVDQVTKLYAIHYLAGQPTQSYLGDIFRIQYAENTGGFLSLGSTLSPQLRFWLLTILNGLILMIGFFYLMVKCSHPPLVWWGVTLLVGGGLGNLIDRARLGGIVVDFLNLGLGPVRTGIFNVADMAISAGVIMFFLSSFESKPTTHQTTVTTDQPSELEQPVSSQSSAGQQTTSRMGTT